MPREMDDIIHYVCRQSNEANPDAGVQRGTWLALSPWHHSVPTEVLRSSSDASRSCELLVSNNYCFSVFTNRDHAPERVWACITLNQVWRMTHILSACRSKQAGSFKLSHTHVWTCKKTCTPAFFPIRWDAVPIITHLIQSEYDQIDPIWSYSVPSDPFTLRFCPFWFHWFESPPLLLVIFVRQTQQFSSHFTLLNLGL